IPRKGHDFLVRALADLSDLPWSLRIIGDPSRDVTFADRLTALISDLGLQDRISLDGVVSDEDLRAAYLQSDIFALASEHEGYGMAFAEAVLSGLPVIGTTGGAISDTVPSDAGILVPPGDMEALKAALREIMTDTDRRRTLVDGAHRSASAFATWDGAADRFAAILETVL
ncbi:MAG: glycosyltransferase, partial [Pseudomonadota bacterium]